MTSRDRHPAAFTLAELLVAMAIIAVLAAITVVSVGAIANDARLSSGTNTVVAVLDNARSLALRRNKPVLVVFRPRLDGNDQYVEAVTAEYSGDSRLFGFDLYDRFVPVADVPARALPRGIQVAGPYYRRVSPLYDGRRADTLWVTQTYLRNLPGEAAGELVGVMYGPDGSTMTRSSVRDSDQMWVDFNVDGLPDVDQSDPDLPDTGDPWELDHPDDETLVNVVPFIAVYDDVEAREITGALGWDDHQTRTTELSDFVTDRADRLHFNRYTGVVMR